MPCIAYRQKKFTTEHLGIIEKVNRVVEKYKRDGFDLTLRQIYYQFVAKDWFPDDRTFIDNNGKWVRSAQGSKNAEPNYKWLGDIINDGRCCGEIDWNAIVDRTRNLDGGPHDCGDPVEFMKRLARAYTLDPWETQPARVEVWIEKDAVEGIAERACEERRVPFFSCRGNVSQSSMWEAAQRLNDYVEQGLDVHIIHLGDHDPSGVDMTRDIEARLHEFGSDIIEVRRIALNMDQVRQYNPPPNPVKLKDSRSPAYVREFGEECWELDALEPSVMMDLIKDAVDDYIDRDAWEVMMDEEHKRTDAIVAASKKIKL